MLLARRILWGFYPTLLAICLNFFASANQALGGPPPGATEFAAAARKNLSEARTRHRTEPGDAQAAWQFARACFDAAEFATNRTERAQIAEEGIAVCRQLIVREPNSAPAHYYLGMNLGQLARTKGLSALKIVDEMQREFTAARDLDAHLDYGGPERNLGLLYRDAPSVGSIGSRNKARYHLERAALIAPDYPENRLNLVEAYLKWSDRNGARRELRTIEELWPSARTNFVGQTWAASWADWEQRLKQAKKKVEEPPKALESPRQKD